MMKMMSQVLAMPVIRDDDATMEMAVRREISSYLTLAHYEIVDYVRFWEDERTNFPNLSKLADALYGIPATSAISESNFSLTAYVDNAKSSKCSAKLVTEKVFMSANYDFFVEIGAV